MAIRDTLNNNRDVNPSQEYIEDRLDDISPTESDFLNNRKSSFLSLMVSPETAPYDYPSGQDSPEFRTWRKSIEETPAGKTLVGGFSLLGKGLSLVGDVSRRINKVVTAAPIMQASVKQGKVGAEIFNAHLYNGLRFQAMLTSHGTMSKQEIDEWADSYVDAPKRSYLAMGKDVLKNMTILFSPKAYLHQLPVLKAAITPAKGSMDEYSTYFEQLGEGYYKTLTGDEPSDAWKMIGDASFETIITTPDAVGKLIGRAQNIKQLGAPIGVFSSKPLTVIEKAELSKSFTQTGTEILARYPQSARSELWKLNRMKWYNTYANLEDKMMRTAIDYQKHLINLTGQSYRVPVQLSKQEIDDGRKILDLLLDGIEPRRAQAEVEKIVSRSLKYRAASGLRAEFKGKQGAINARWALSGEDYVKDFDVDLSWMTPQAEDMIFNVINALPEWDAQHASTAMFKILDHKLPTRSEAAALEMAFGGGVAEKLAKLIGRPLDYGEMFTDIMNLPRSIQTSFDLSAPLRQGDMALKAGYASEWADAFVNMIKAGGPAKYAQQIDDLATFGPRAALYKEAGLAHTKLSKFGKLVGREEEFLSSYAERIPILGKGVVWSEKTYTAFMNKLRMDMFDSTLLQWQREGRALQPKDYKALGEYINHMTGRGDLKTAQRALDGVFGLAGKETATAELKIPAVASGLMYSPRWFLSKLQVHSDLFASESPLVRKLVARDLANYYRTNISMLRMAKAGESAFGWKVETDPTSGDFGKIQVGNTRYDIWGPMNPLMRQIARMESGVGKSTTTGELYDLNRKDLNLRFLRSQASPTIGLVITLATGETFIGDDVNLTKADDMGKLAYETLVPLSMQDIVDAVRFGENGFFAKAAVGSAFLGAGAQTYQPSPFQKAYQKKEVLSREMFGKPISELQVTEKAMLQKAAEFDPEIIMLEKQGMFEDRDDIVQLTTDVQVKAQEDILSMLPKEVNRDLTKTGTSIGPISKTVHIGAFPVTLNYQEFNLYKRYVAERIKQNHFPQSGDAFMDTMTNEKVVKKSIELAQKDMYPILMERNTKKDAPK